MLDFLKLFYAVFIIRTAHCTFAALIVLALTACGHGNSPKLTDVCPGDPFYCALVNYLEQAPENRDHSGIRAFMGKSALIDLNELIDKFGSAAVARGIRQFPKNRLHELLNSHGDDFFLMALHCSIGSHHYLSILNQRFGIDPHWLADAMKNAGGRFSGALIIFETIDKECFDLIARIFEGALPAEVFLQSFYEDPYLLATAMRIFSQRDPLGNELKAFLAYFPDSHTRSELFLQDLPGLVVAFSTIQEIKSGKKVLWVKEFLNISDRQLADLIRRKPVDLAYVLHGGHRIGIHNFEQVIESIGRELFRVALTDHTAWLAKFLNGLEKVTILSSGADFHEINAAKRIIESRYPFLLRYDNYTEPNINKIMALFADLPAASDYLNSRDSGVQTRVYLLGLLAVYQHVLHIHMPDAVLTRSQFELLKSQILYSTRFSKNLNNMMSNFEVGRHMVKGNSMQTIILYLAHELAHQIYSISGFDAPLLSAASIHECSADIAARCIAQRLAYRSGMEGYWNKIIRHDDYSDDAHITEFDLIGHGIPHKIGRTQLGYIMQAYANRSYDLDWETLFSVSLSVLQKKTKMKHLSYIQNLVAGYMYSYSEKKVTHLRLHRFIGNHEKFFEAVPQPIKSQIADVRTVEEMIAAAQALMLRAVKQ
jgi:hypothetical protein